MSYKYSLVRILTISYKINYKTMELIDLFNGAYDVVEYAFGKNYNLVDNDNDYTIEIPLLGVKKNELCITFDAHELKIKRTIEESKKKFMQRGFTKPGSFERRFDLTGLKYDQDNIKSKMEDGILYIILPKSKKDSKTITID